MNHLEICGHVKQVENLTRTEVEEWDRLSVATTSARSPFMSVHFARAVAESGVDARACVLHQSDEIRAFFPYQYSSKLGRWLKAAQRIGGELSDAFGIVAQNGFQIETAALLRLAHINYIHFTHLDEAQLGHGLHGEKPRTGLRIQLDQSSNNPLKTAHSVDRKYLKDTERRQRKLCDEVGPITFQFDVEQDRDDLLSELVNKKRAQYKTSGVDDALSSPWKRQTLRHLSNYRFATCRGILSTMFAGDKWIASHFGLMGNGIFHLWLPVYNPEFSRYSPGRLLLHHILESSGTHGLHKIDRAEGDTPTKRETANEEYKLYRGIWRNKTGASQINHRFNQVKWKLGL